METNSTKIKMCMRYPSEAMKRYRPSALRGDSEIIEKRQRKKINSNFSMAEKEETRGSFAWEPH
ncbi:MAG: hypothetical protein WC584_03015 [Candidatus Pacearchaeota archaeon]